MGASHSNYHIACMCLYIASNTPNISYKFIIFVHPMFLENL